MVCVTLFYLWGKKKKKKKLKIFRRSEIQTFSVLQPHLEFVSGLLWLGLRSGEGDAGGSKGLLDSACAHTRIHTYTDKTIHLLLKLLEVWLRTGDGDCGLSSDTAGGSGDACPLNHKPREPLAKKCIMGPAGPWVVCVCVYCTLICLYILYMSCAFIISRSYILLSIFKLFCTFSK